MGKTRRAHLTGVVVGAWLDKLCKLTEDQAKTAAKELQAVFRTVTPWQDRRTNSLLTTVLIQLPALCFEYEGHQFPTDYDIEAFRRFMIRLVAIRPDLVPPAFAALKWGDLGRDAESAKAVKAVDGYIARFHPAPPAKTPVQEPAGEKSVDVIAMLSRLTITVQELTARVAQLESAPLTPAGIAQELKAQRDILSKLDGRVGAMDGQSARYTQQHLIIPPAAPTTPPLSPLPPKP